MAAVQHTDVQSDGDGGHDGCRPGLHMCPAAAVSMLLAQSREMETQVRREETSVLLLDA